MIILSALALALTLAISAVSQLSAYAQQDKVQNALISKQYDTINQLRQQVKNLGHKPVADAPTKSEVEKAQEGAQGPQGPAGENATEDQISDAVRDYCFAHGGCIGVPGQIGAAGPGPTEDQIAAAVADYCAANGNCTGPAGAAGANGADGAPGAPGAAGADGATYTPVAQQCILTGSGTAVQTTWQNSATGGQTNTTYPAACIP